MTIEPGIVIAVAVPCVGALVWLVNLAGRVRVLEDRFSDIKADLGEIKETLKQFLVQ